MDIPLVLAPLAGILALLAAAVIARGSLRTRTGEARIVEISDAVKQGAMAYMNGQYRTIAVVAAVLVAVLLVVSFASDSPGGRGMWLWTTVGFVVGSLFSAAAGYIGMHISVRANVRVA